jgi:hypothetical protein
LNDQVEFSSVRAVNARKLWKVNSANTEVAELFQCDANYLHQPRNTEK